MKYWIFKKAYEEGEIKVKDHDHVRRKDPGFARLRIFNLNYSLSKEKLLFFIIWKSCDSHLIFQEFEKYRFKINVITKTIEKSMSFNI